MLLNHVLLSLSGLGGAVRGGGKCPTAPPAGEGHLGDQSEESGIRPAECSGAERQTQQSGHLAKAFSSCARMLDKTVFIIIITTTPIYTVCILYLLDPVLTPLCQMENSTACMLLQGVHVLYIFHDPMLFFYFSLSRRRNSLKSV